MEFVEIFYSVCLISTISIIWFYTDTLTWYLQLFNMFSDFRLTYSSFINKHPDKYFPDFLYYKSTLSHNRTVKFLLKLLSCPFCLIAWLSIFAGVLLNNPISIGCLYVCSLWIVLFTRRLI